MLDLTAFVVALLKNRAKFLMAIGVLAAGGALGAGLVMATATGESASYAIEEAVCGGGGTLAAAGATVANSTAGQAAVGVASSASYGLEAGYWHAGASVPVTLQRFTVE